MVMRLDTIVSRTSRIMALMMLMRIDGGNEGGDNDADYDERDSHDDHDDDHDDGGGEEEDDIAISCLTSILDNSYDKYHKIDEVENLNVLAGFG